MRILSNYWNTQFLLLYLLVIKNPDFQMGYSDGGIFGLQLEVRASRLLVHMCNNNNDDNNPYKRVKQRMEYLTKRRRRWHGGTLPGD